MGVYTYDKENDELKRIAGYTIYSATPIGTIFPFMGSTIPYGFLLCDGTAYSATDYPDLWNILPSTVKDTTNNTFTIDLREATTKGVGLSGKSTVHYDADGIALGEFIEDRNKSHTHDWSNTHNHDIADSGHSHGVTDPGHKHGGYFGTGSGNRGGDYNTVPVGVTQNTNSATTGISIKSATTGISISNKTISGTTTSSGSATNEVKAVGVNYIIKALVVPTDADQSVIDELGEVKNSVANKLNKNTTVQGVITAQPVTYRSFTLTDTNNMQHGYQPHCLLLISREEVILVNVRIHSTDISVEATKITGGSDNITALAYTVDNTAHSITFYATLATWAMVFAVQKITIQDIQPSSVAKIDSIPDNVTSLEIKNTVTRGTCTLASAVTSGGNITWVKSGKVVTLRVNLGASGTIPQNATIATGAPKALTATTGIAVTSTGAAKMLQVDTSGVVTHTNGGGILTSTQLYGDITYITSE